MQRAYCSYLSAAYQSMEYIHTPDSYAQLPFHSERPPEVGTSFKSSHHTNRDPEPKDEGAPYLGLPRGISQNLILCDVIVKHFATRFY